MKLRKAIKRGLAVKLGKGIIGPGPKLLKAVDFKRTYTAADGKTYYPLKGESIADAQVRHLRLVALRERRPDV